MLTYEQYLDKVYGCWLGKCVVGTIGAPYEGMKQLLHLKYDPSMIEKMLPNDDLDLQVLWLKVLEEKGIRITSEDLAEAFDRYNIYWPGEYACFKKNYERGLHPPYTAYYENGFYFEGMGCPIRAEIWGLILPLNPDLSAELCAIDGSLDHYGNSVYFEQFWAAMIAKGFEESEIEPLIRFGMRYLPEDSRAHALVSDVLDWSARSDSVEFIRSRIIAEYGHCDCTNSFMNIGITLTVLLKHWGDPIGAAIAACNCGFDTDCTAGNAGALMGLILGGKYLEEQCGFRDSGYVLSLDYARPTDKICDLARDTAAVGIHFLNHYPGAVRTIENVPEGSEIRIDYPEQKLSIEADYPQGPYIRPGQTLEVRFRIHSPYSREVSLNLCVQPPEDMEAEVPATLRIPAHGTGEFSAAVRYRPGVRTLSERNLFELRLNGDGCEQSFCFGAVGCTPYLMYGPFWENNIEIDLGDNSRHYNSFIGGDTQEEFADRLRFYHLNMLTDVNREYLPLDYITEERSDATRYECCPRPVYCKGDEIRMEEITPFRGPCTVYLKRVIVCEEEMELKIHIGHTDAFAFWLNGELQRECNSVENYTPENYHLYPRRLRKGENVLIFKLCRRSDSARFSLTFLHNRDCPPHCVGLRSKAAEGLSKD